MVVVVFRLLGFGFAWFAPITDRLKLARMAYEFMLRVLRSRRIDCALFVAETSRMQYGLSIAGIDYPGNWLLGSWLWALHSPSEDGSADQDAEYHEPYFDLVAHLVFPSFENRSGFLLS